MFNIGDKIVYPMHGAGIIETIEEKEILGEKKKYYILRIPIDDMRVMLPINSINDFGIRGIIGYNEFEKVVEVLKKSIIDEEDNWGRRYKKNADKIRSGDIYSISEVIKDLMVREISKGLSPGEKKILENAEQILYSELMLVTGLTLDELKKLISDIIISLSC